MFRPSDPPIELKKYGRAVPDSAVRVRRALCSFRECYLSADVDSLTGPPKYALPRFLMDEQFDYPVKSHDCQSQIAQETSMIRVTAKAAAYILERGGDLTLYSKVLSN
jgi:hypothetical protein